MISYEVYKIIHLLGMFGMFLSFGGLLMYVVGGGLKSEFAHRKLVAASHGISLFLILLGGFGMAARLQLHTDWPLWVWIKLGIWVLFGAALAIPYRVPALAKPLWFALPILGAFTAYIVIMKPFV